MNRGDLTNEQWERLQPLLPSEKPATGRPALSHRQVLNGRPKQFRRIATHYEKRATNYAAMLTFAATLLWLKYADTP